MAPPTEPLSQTLRDRIVKHGSIPFREFMEAALYHPEHGYYTSGRASIGRRGDFITSVSVGSLFGRMLSRQFAEMWERMERPRPFTIVEQGAHAGDFAKDALEGLRAFAPDCFAATEYVIVEPSKSFRERQRVKLAEFSGQVRWETSLETAPRFAGVHFSNELIDAFPVHRVRWTGSEWVERYVALDGDGFVFVDHPITLDALRARLALLPGALPAGYETEINLSMADWIHALAGKLSRGFVLLIDYGYPRDEYYRPERANGTLSAYRQHRREPNPLAFPGDVDLTAHVDFTTLAEQAANERLATIGFSDQQRFFVGLSPLHFTDASAALTPEQERELREFKTLMHPQFLGHSFKVLCLATPDVASATLSGLRFAGDAARALRCRFGG